ADRAWEGRSDRGNPDVCPVFGLHKIFTSAPERAACAAGCRTAGIGCLDCKGVLLKHMLPPLAEIRERRERFAARPREIVEILHAGSQQARAFAQKTIGEVRAVVNLQP